LLEAAPDPVVISDKHGKIVIVNKEAEKLFGYSRMEMLDRAVEMLLPEPQRSSHVEHRERYGAKPEPRSMGKGLTLYGQKKDGRKVPVEISLSPIRTEDEVLIASAIRDVSERKRTQEELELQIRRISALHEINLAITSTLDLSVVLNVLMKQIDLFLPYTAVVIWLVDKNTGQLKRSACWQLDESVWLGRDLPIPVLVQKVIDDRNPVVTTNIQTDPRTVRPDFYRENGLVSYLGVPLIVDEKVLGVLGFLTREQHNFAADEIKFLLLLANQAAIAIDNSQLHEEVQRQARELADINKLQADFAALIAHDLRSPLCIMISVAEMMRKESLGPVNSEQDAWLGRMISSGASMKDLINDFLDVSKLESAEIELDEIEVTLDNLLAAIVEEYRIPAEKKSVALTFEIASDVPLLHADPNRLKQVFRNLIDNAVKFTRAGGAITIQATLDGDDAVRIQINDSGVGIPRAEVGTLFQKYRQATNTTKSGQPGTGLGLVICKMIVEAHGGKIWVESVEGKGTSIIFTLRVERKWGALSGNEKDCSGAIEDSK